MASGKHFESGTLTSSGEDLKIAPVNYVPGFERLPFSLRVVLENLVRQSLLGADTAAAIDGLINRKVGIGLPFFPARVFLQDLLGVPLLVDLASLRDAVAEAGGDASAVSPSVAADLVIDHSLRVDVFGSAGARATNLALEYQRNFERFSFLRWCQNSFDRLRVVPPGKGIMHQINLEWLGKVVWVSETSKGRFAYPDTVVGTDSHTTMINGLGILGWGVGGIEAEAIMLGKPISLPLPEVVGVEVSGILPDGAMPTDLVLAITERLRNLGVVGKFVEFFGKGLETLSVPDRGTIANMAPEYGATCVYFPVDQRASEYLRMTGRTEEHIRLIEEYSTKQSLWRDEHSVAPEFDEVVTFDLRKVRRSIAGPWRPEDRIDLEWASQEFHRHLIQSTSRETLRAARVEDEDYVLKDGAVVIAAITSCTNTSNPVNMIAAGLVARNAVARGLRSKPWVKTSLAPGSQVVAAILENAGLQAPLDSLGFQVVGFGCTTCNGMSGPLSEKLAAAIESERLVAVAVLSGNRNFEGRIHPNVRAAYLASPPLVVAYALTGSMTADILNDPLGADGNGQLVYLKDIWPSTDEINRLIATAYNPGLFRQRYSDLFEGDEMWRAMGGNLGERFDWVPDSTYIRRAPYFEGLPRHPESSKDLTGMRPLVILGDSITTDHISPSGAITMGSEAADFLLACGVSPKDFNSYGTRRGNHEVAVRATFANIRLRNLMCPSSEGSVTRLMPEDKLMSVFAAASEYIRREVPLVVVAGCSYGCGSSRDWAAKGVALLNVRAIIARSFERIHRTNLLGMGVLPLQFPNDVSAKTLELSGSEVFDLVGLSDELGVRAKVTCAVRRSNGEYLDVPLIIRIDTDEELEYYKNGGILPAVWRDYVQAEEQKGRLP